MAIIKSVRLVASSAADAVQAGSIALSAGFNALESVANVGNMNAKAWEITTQTKLQAELEIKREFFSSQGYKDHYVAELHKEYLNNNSQTSELFKLA